MDKANPIGPAETTALRETPAVSKGFFNKQRKNNTDLNNKPPSGEKASSRRLRAEGAGLHVDPFLIWLFVFKYLPLWGWTIAFQDFKPAKKIFDQEWVGLRHFTFLFQDEHFLRVMRNTLAMSFINLVLGFVTAIVLAILLNESRNLMFKRVVQTISYLPHFISWVVVASIISTALSADGGIINELLMWFGIIKEPILWLGEGNISGEYSVFRKYGRMSAGTPLYIWRP